MRKTNENNINKRVYDLVKINFEGKEVECKIYFEDYNGNKLFQEMFPRTLLMINKNEFDEKFLKKIECKKFIRLIESNEFEYETLQEDVEIDDFDVPFGEYSNNREITAEVVATKNEMIYKFVK